MSFLGEKSGGQDVQMMSGFIRATGTKTQADAFDKNVLAPAMERLPTQGQQMLGGIIQGGAQLAGQVMQENQRFDRDKELTRIRSGLPTESQGQVSDRFAQAKSLQGSMSPRGFADQNLGQLRQLRERVQKIRGL